MRRMHNHIGKMLPEIPDMDTQLALSAKMIDKRQATPKVSTSSIYFFAKKIFSRQIVFRLLCTHLSLKGFVGGSAIENIRS
jgi:hypothetical protein